MHHADRRLQRIGFVLSTILGVIATFGLLLPASVSPVSVGVGVDKVVHFLICFVVALPSLMTGPRNWIWLVPVIIAFGILIELIQPYFGRGAEVGDAVANAVGVLCAVPVGHLAHRAWLQPRQMAKNERAKRDRGLRDRQR